MPVLWTVHHETRLVEISVEGVVQLEDMEECVAGILTPATRSYRKLVDLTGRQSAFSRDDLVTLAEHVRERSTGKLGALAVTVESNESEQEARLFDSVSDVDRPLKIFRDLQEARAWLDTQPSRTVVWPEEAAPITPRAHPVPLER